MGAGPGRDDAPGMHKRLTLLAIAVTGAFATAPAHAAGCAPGSADKPDLGFVDSNCDGVDGDKAHAIFVAPGGDDNADGYDRNRPRHDDDVPPTAFAASAAAHAMPAHYVLIQKISEIFLLAVKPRFPRYVRKRGRPAS